MSKSETKDSIHIREATRADIPQLAQLKREVAGAAYAKQGVDTNLLAKWLESSCSEDFFSYRIGRKDYYVLCAFNSAGELIGVGGFRQRGTRADGSSVGMYVRGQRKGVGSKLYSRIVKLAKDKGCNKMRAAIWRTNIPSQTFVQKRHGMVKVPGGYRESTVGIRVDNYECSI